MGLTEVDAAIINDELGRGAAVGTPYELGGIPYDQLGVTGHGVAEVVDEIADQQNLLGSSVTVQGFGAVGHSVAKRLHELGYRVTAVYSVKGALANADGLDILAMLRERGEVGDYFVYNHPKLAIEPGQELFTQADIVVPAALQNVVSEHNVGDIKAKLVVEAANLPTNAGAQAALREKGVTVVPDFIANAGGVVSAAFAMESRFSPFRVDPNTILETVSTKLRANAVTT